MKTTVEKLKTKLCSSRKRIRDLELACLMYSKECSRLRKAVHERTDPRVFDYAVGM
jgi:hypothetical protein